MLFIYILGIIILLRFSYKQNNKVLFSPTFMCCVSFMVAWIFLTILKDDWLVDFSAYTIFIIFLGLFSMLLGERMFSKQTRLDLSFCYRNSFANVECLEINTMILWLIIIINFFSSYIYYRDVLSIIGGNRDLSEDAMADYKMAVVLGSEKIGRITNQFNLFTNATAYIFAFIFIFNYSCGYRTKKNILYFIGVIPHLINTFLSGGRINYILFVTSILWFFYFVRISKGFARRSYKEFLNEYGFRMSVIGVGVLIVFFLIRVAVGRANTVDMSFKEYIGEYIAAPSLNFDYYLNITKEPNPLDFQIHKTESFLGIAQFLSVFDKEPNKSNPILYFRSGPHGEKFGNVYTALARYYSDFGIIGVCILPFIMGCILMKILSSCLNVKNRTFDCNLLFKVLLFAFLASPLIVYAADDVFFRFFRHGTVEVIIFLYLLSKYAIKFRYKVS